MSDQPEELQAGELLRAIGKVPEPNPRVLEDARETLWAAVASTMLRVEPSGGQAAATERPTGREHRAAHRHHTDRPEDKGKMSMGGGDLDG
jgi:hypothetical protein